MPEDAECDVLELKARLIANERAKARATFLNGLGVAVLAVGGLAPVSTAVAASHPPSISASVLVLVCLGTSFALHSWALRVLQGLEP